MRLFRRLDIDNINTHDNIAYQPSPVVIDLASSFTPSPSRGAFQVYPDDLF